MEIKTKYNVGDSVYILQGLTPTPVTITGVTGYSYGSSLTFGEAKSGVRYNIHIYGPAKTVEEGDLFESVEEMSVFLQKKAVELNVETIQNSVIGVSNQTTHAEVL